MVSLAKRDLSKLRVERFSTEEEFDSLRQDWDELLDDSNQCVYFLRWSWNRLWWRTHAPPHSRLFLIACYDGSDNLVGLAPLYWRERSLVGVSRLQELVFLGTGVPTSTSEQLDLIARRGFEQPVAAAIADYLLQASDVDRLWLSEIPIASIMLPHFRRAIGPSQSLKICNRSHYVDTSQDWESFNRSLRKSMRTNVTYYTRRLFKLFDCKFQRVQTLEELEPAMDTFVRLHQARWESKGEPGSFALPSFEGFLKDAMRSTLAEGRLQLWTLELDGVTAAVLLAFVDNGVAHYFQGGFNPMFTKESLGTVMCGLCIKDCIESPEVKEFNFMGGDPSYKERWTSASRDSVALEWLRPNLRSQSFAIAEQSRNVGRSFLRLVTPGIVKEKVQAARRRKRRRR
jgi:CelD/BcsL family acetyltransferase involved in cellulose biosynthesis